MSIQIHVPDHLLYEDEYVLVLNKPASLMVEPDRNGHPNLLHQVQRYQRSFTPKGQEVYAQHIHRLDRPVSGIVLFARQRSVLKNLSEQFATRTIKKYYQALSERAPDITEGTLEHWHRKEKKKAVIADDALPYMEKVSLHYSVKPYAGGLTLWDIALHTGRYHQIRAQLAHVGCPVIGDVTYGADKPYKPDAIALHASRLTFAHPVTGEEITVNAQPDFMVL